MTTKRTIKARTPADLDICYHECMGCEQQSDLHWHCRDRGCPAKGLMLDQPEYVCTQLSRGQSYLTSHVNRDRKENIRASDLLVSLRKKHAGMDGKEFVPTEYRRYTRAYAHTRTLTHTHAHTRVCTRTDTHTHTRLVIFQLRTGRRQNGMVGSVLSQVSYC